MNNKILYGLILLLTVSLTLGVVSASENITESALLGVEESYIIDDEVLSLSNEDNDQNLGLLNEENIEDNETLSLSNEENMDDDEILGFWEPVQTTEKGADYVLMSNGYTAFCADRTGTFPTKGTQYYTEQQYILTHDKRVGERVDNKLRLVMVHYADRPEFHEKIRIAQYAAGSFSRTQQLVWYLTNYDELKPYSFQYLDKDPLLRDAYYDIINRHNNGEWINEDSMTYSYDGYEVIYEFLAFRSDSTYQKLIGYKKTINEIPDTPDTPDTPKNPSMIVDKKSLNPNVLVGEKTDFLITVTNTGEVDLNNVYVEEQIPDGLTYADYSDKTQWRKDGNIFYYNNVLGVGQSASFTISFNTHINGTFVNCVVAGSDETGKDEAENKTVVLQPGLIVTKESLNPNVLVGEKTDFLITVTNTGEVDLNNVYVEEQIPDGLTYADYSDKTQWRKDGNIFYYNNVLGVGQSASFTISFNTHINGTFVNCVVAGSDESKKDEAENETVVLQPGLIVTKESLNPNVLVGEQTKFLITVTNTGEIDLHNVYVIEDLNNGLTYDSYYDESEWNNDGDTFYYNNILEVSKSASFTIVFNTSMNGTFINCVVAGSDESGKDEAENKTVVVEPKLDVQKITLTPIVKVGDLTSFEIVVKNIGDVKLHNVFLEETSYEGLIYNSFAKNDEWTYSLNNGKHRWTLNRELSPNAEAMLHVQFDTVEVGEFTNIVTAGSDNTTDVQAENTTIVYNVTHETPVSNSTQDPNLKVEKIALEKVLLVNDKAEFEIIVQNTGNVALNDVTVFEESFDGLTYNSFRDDSGLWIKNNDLSWTYNDILHAGEYASFYVIFTTTKTGEFTNIVSASSDKTPKTHDNDTVTVIAPSLDVQKITINKTVHVGEQVTFEILVQNTGDVDLNKVTVTEYEFNGLTYAKYMDYTGNWVYNGDLTWTLNVPLKVGEISGFFVVFDTTKVGNFVNTVIGRSNEVPNIIAKNTTEVINITPETPVVPEEPTPVEPVTPVVPEEPTPVEPVTPVVPEEPTPVEPVTPVVPEESTPVEPVTPVVPEEPTPIVPEVPVAETPDQPLLETPEVVENNTPETPQNSTASESPKENHNTNVLPATGNPLILVLLALIALGAAGLRRKD